jgi:DNA excision repair protein ERCC-3
VSVDPTNPLIVQADRSIFLEVFSPKAEEARAAIAVFAELEKSPEHIHTYKITPLSLWNAAAAGVSAETMLTSLTRFAKFPVPENVLADVRELTRRWGRLVLSEFDQGLLLEVQDPDRALLLELTRHKKVAPLLGRSLSPNAILLPVAHRGLLKQTLLELGYPVQDVAGYSDGLEFAIGLSSRFTVREYQKQAAQAFYLGGSKEGGSGVVVLPPGAGKTVVGMVAMGLVSQRTLVLTTNRTSVKQWLREMLQKTTLSPDDMVEYIGGAKQKLAPVTVCTYQMLTTRKRGTAQSGTFSLEDYPHMALFRSQEWGLIIYDEVHLLPAPIFRMTAEVQARRRLGLTATLIREDGREGDVFSLIGPKRFDIPWKDLEAQGFIATAVCTEVRMRLPEGERLSYAVAEEHTKFRIAAENPRKLEVLTQILQLHQNQPTLIIGQYIGQLELIAQTLEVPLITGETPQRERERLFHAFRDGVMTTLVLSKVGNFALDLPEAQILVQVSGQFGSRQEEAQRLGRLLRPKKHGETAQFYSLVTRETKEEDFSQHRQLFLTEQGYQYRIQDETDWLEPDLNVSQANKLLN